MLLLAAITTLVPAETAQPASPKKAPVPSVARPTVVFARTLVGWSLAFCVWKVIGPRQSFTAPDLAAVVNASLVGPVDFGRRAMVCATYWVEADEDATFVPL